MSSPDDMSSSHESATAFFFVAGCSCTSDGDNRSRLDFTSAVVLRTNLSSLMVVGRDGCVEHTLPGALLGVHTAKITSRTPLLFV